MRPTIEHPCRTPWQQKWIALDCLHPKLQGLADAAQEFCKRWFHCDRRSALLVLVGQSNSGKTHTAKAVYRVCYSLGRKAFDDGKGITWKHLPSAMFLRWPETVDNFKEGNYGVLADMFECDFLALDDIGAEHDPSRSAANKLCQVLSRREWMHTVVTTNIVPEEWASRFDTRIADRLLRNSVVVDLRDVPSYAEATALRC